MADATPTSALAFDNFFSATLTGDLTASSTDILLDNVPTASEGFLVIEPDSSSKREVIYYNSKTALKVVCPDASTGRGQDGTSATTHSTGVTVIMAPIAAFYEALKSFDAMDDIETEDIGADALSTLRSQNFLINGNMDIWQRNTSATPNDDVYCGADRWNFLTETNGAWTVARDTDVPAGSRYSMKLTNVTLNKQCAIVQIIETANAKVLDDGTVSLSFYAKTTSSEISNLRAAILTWGSTADSVTSDVISSWAQNGTDPTWAANWTVENTPSNLALTNSWARYTIENVAIDTATVNNIAVVIWVDDGTIAANDDFWVTQVQLNYGSTATPYKHRTYAEELALCQRYCFQMKTNGTAQTTVSGMGYAAGTGRVAAMAPHPVPFRVVPTITATGTDWQAADGVSAGLNGTGTLIISTDPAGNEANVILSLNVSGATSKSPYIIRGDGGNNRQYILDAEL